MDNVSSGVQIAARRRLRFDVIAIPGSQYASERILPVYDGTDKYGTILRSSKERMGKKKRWRSEPKVQNFVWLGDSGCDKWK